MPLYVHRQNQTIQQLTAAAKANPASAQRATAKPIPTIKPRKTGKVAQDSQLTLLFLCNIACFSGLLFTPLLSYLLHYVGPVGTFLLVLAPPVALLSVLHGTPLRLVEKWVFLALVCALCGLIGLIDPSEAGAVGRFVARASLQYGNAAPLPLLVLVIVAGAGLWQHLSLVLAKPALIGWLITQRLGLSLRFVWVFIKALFAAKKPIITTPKPQPKRRTTPKDFHAIQAAFSAHDVELAVKQKLTERRRWLFVMAPGPHVKIKTIKAALPDVANKIAAILPKDCRANLTLSAIDDHPEHPGHVCLAVPRPRSDIKTFQLEDALKSPEFQAAKAQNAGGLPAIIGCHESGGVHVARIGTSDTPHLFYCGGTGGGKTNSMKATLLSMIAASPPERLQIIVSDGKANSPDFAPWIGGPHFPSTDISANAANVAAKLLLYWTEHHAKVTALIIKHGVSSIVDLHKMGVQCPYTCFVADEWSAIIEENGGGRPNDALIELYMAAPRGEDSEYEEIDSPDALRKLTTGKFLNKVAQGIAKVARSYGFLLFIGTQRPSDENLPKELRGAMTTKCIFRLPQKGEAMMVNAPEAINLKGNGDMIYVSGGSEHRLQSPLVTTIKKAA